MSNSGPLDSEPTQALSEKTLTYLLILGCVLLSVSSIMLYLSTQEMLGNETEGHTVSVIYMLCARLSGMGAFVIGVVAIFNQRWTSGALLLIASVGLPFVSLFIHGTI